MEEINFSFSIEETASLIEATADGLRKRCFWALTDPDWRQPELHEPMKEVVGTLKSAYSALLNGMATYSATNEVDIDPTFMDSVTFNLEAHDRINEIVNSESWDDVALIPIQRAEALLNYDFMPYAK